MEAFRDSVVAREAPHADDGRKPCAQRVPQRAPGFMCCVGEVTDHFSEFLEGGLLVRFVRVLRLSNSHSRVLKS